jgi:DNA polymerase-3 subunit delta
MSSAANHLLRMLALLNLSFEDLTASGLKKYVSNIAALLEDGSWLSSIVDYCRQNGRDVPPAADSESALLRSIDKGFPPGNCLIITTDTIDKRRKVYKALSKIGVVVDCSVPKGNRKVDKDSQTAVMKEIAGAILSENGKSLAPGAFKLLCEVTGFDLRTFCGNLEKLISYIGNQEQITQNDIQAVLKRTKKDPVYAFTNAIVEKNIGDSLFYMDSLMTEATGSMQPEQILVAILNQVRKLLRVKEFCATDAGRAWFPGCPYGQFKTAVLPAVMEFDKKLIQELGNWQEQITVAKEPQKGGTGARRRKKKTKQKTDLSLVKSANNPYPVFQTFQKADRFSEKELIDAFDHLSRADMRIKTGSENKKLVLEELVFNICQAS